MQVPDCGCFRICQTRRPTLVNRCFGTMFCFLFPLRRTGIGPGLLPEALGQLDSKIIETVCVRIVA